MPLKHDGTDRVPKIRVREIDVDVFLQLCVSHSKLAHAEYKRNASFNTEHFAHKAEDAVLKELYRLNLMDECFELMGA